MTDWIRALNPTSPLATEAEALTAARASSLALFLSVLWSIIGIAYMLTAGQAAMDAAMKQAATDAPEMAGVISMVAQATLVFSAFWVLVQLVLGFVQWVKPNVVIPIIFAILAGLGLLWGLFSLLIAGSAEVAAAVPGWQLWIGLFIGAIQLVMHIAGIRGASKLRELRAQGAYSAI